jgi:hypothetical protein
VIQTILPDPIPLSAGPDIKSTFCHERGRCVEYLLRVPNKTTGDSIAATLGESSQPMSSSRAAWPCLWAEQCMYFVFKVGGRCIG